MIDDDTSGTEDAATELLTLHAIKKAQEGEAETRTEEVPVGELTEDEDP